jgi:AcrR family transcriptional regulator
MTSTRNKPAGGRDDGGHGRTDVDVLLDAARDCIIRVGIRRTRLTDVAHRAGVSRMTLYRRWPDMESLLADVMTREWGAVAGAAFESAPGASARTRLVAGLIAGVAALRAHPMFQRILELDPEVLLPYLIDRRGTSIDRLLDLVVAAIRDGQHDGSIRAGPPGLLGRAVVLTAQGFTLSVATMADGATPGALDAELRTLIDRYLAAPREGRR